MAVEYARLEAAISGAKLILVHSKVHQANKQAHPTSFTVTGTFSQVLLLTNLILQNYASEMHQPVLRQLLILPRHRTTRLLTTSPYSLAKARSALPPRPTVPEDTLTEVFLKGSGPGGQKINKTSSAVQLKHLPTGIVIKSQATRSRSQNRKIARTLLAEKLEVLEKGSESRVAVKQERARKKKASSGKKARRKYRALGENMGDEDDGTSRNEDGTADERKIAG
ncbi:hypothetical protein MMC18_005902 [Xylographa bjoerkii]|nr:hypothetical protein [Xylographa bjoerkii]